MYMGHGFAAHWLSYPEGVITPETHCPNSFSRDTAAIGCPGSTGHGCQESAADRVGQQRSNTGTYRKKNNTHTAVRHVHTVGSYIVYCADRRRLQARMLNMDNRQMATATAIKSPHSTTCSDQISKFSVADNNLSTASSSFLFYFVTYNMYP